jgi:hypothetical protein
LARGDYYRYASLVCDFRCTGSWNCPTLGQADAILANSHFTASVFKTVFPSINVVPKVVHPGINISAYAKPETSPSDLGGLEEYVAIMSLMIAWP